MCGRTCCTLARSAVPFACSSVTPKGTVPKWNSGSDKNGTYSPSTNVPPTRNTPVMINSNEDDEVVLQEMLWGFVPVWHKGSDPTKHGLTTNNARIESINESRLYKGAVAKNYRCVVVCDGFYEWKAPKNKSDGKQPYLVYAPQDEGVKIEEMGECNETDCYSQEKEWTGPKPLFMAGIYSVWHGPKEDGEEEKSEEKSNDVYNYAIITRAANNVTSWLHDRIPAILPDRDAVQAWLDDSIDTETALENLKPLKEGQIAFHPVSSDVGNVRNQDSSLNRPVELMRSGKEATPSSKLMSNWLKRANSDEDKKKDENKEKKPKTSL